MAGDFFPRTDPEIGPWSTNLLNQITAAGPALGLDAERVERYASRHEAFVLAYRRAVNPSTRGPAATMRKNLARRALESEARLVSHAVKGHPSATTAQLLLLGLNPRRQGGHHPRTPRPDAPPVLIVADVVGRAVSLRLRVGGTTTRRGRPIGARGADVLTFVGDQPPSNPKDWRWVLETIETRVDVTFGAELPPGEKVWFSARWKNARGERGPGAAAVCAYLGGGFPLQRPTSRAMPTAPAPAA